MNIGNDIAALTSGAGKGMKISQEMLQAFLSKLQAVCALLPSKVEGLSEKRTEAFFTEVEKGLVRFVEEGDEEPLIEVGRRLYRAGAPLRALLETFQMLRESIRAEEQRSAYCHVVLLVTGELWRGWIEAGGMMDVALEGADGGENRFRLLYALSNIRIGETGNLWKQTVDEIITLLHRYLGGRDVDFFILDQEEAVLYLRSMESPSLLSMDDFLQHMQGGCLPFSIIVGGVLVGALLVGGEVAASIDVERFLFYQIVAQQIASLLTQVYIRQDERRQMLNWRLLSRLNRSLLGANTYEEVVRILAEHGRVLAFEGVTLFVVRSWDEEDHPSKADVYQLFRSDGEEHALSSRAVSLPRKRWCDRGERFFFWEDLPSLTDRGFGTSQMRELVHRYGVASAFSIHLCHGRKLVGLLIFFSRSREIIERWQLQLDSPIREAVDLLADAVIASIENLTIAELQERSHERVTYLYRALSDLSAAGDYDEALRVLRQYTPVGQADMGVGLVAFSPFWGHQTPRWLYPLGVWRADGTLPRMTRYPFFSLTRLREVLAEKTIVHLGADELANIEGAEKDLLQALVGEPSRVQTLFLMSLEVRGEKVGLLAAAFSFPFVCSEEDRMMMERIGGHAASILQALIRIGDVELRTVRLQTAADVARATTSILDLEPLLNYVVELVRRRFDLYYVGVFLVDETGEWAILRAGTGEAGKKMLANRHRLRVGGRSMIGACVATGEPRIALDVGEEAVRFDNPFLPETRSEMALPLVARGEVIGAMTIQSTEQAAFSEDDIGILQTVADQLANAIENARLFAQVQSSLDEMVAFQRQMTVDSWSQVVTRQEIIGYSYDLRDVLPLAEPSPLPALPEDVIVEEKEGEVVVRAPIAVRGYPIGLLELEDPIAFDPEAEEDKRMLDQVQAQLSLALENRILFEQTRMALTETQLLYETGQRIGAEVTVDGIFFAMLEGLKQRADLNFVEILRIAPATDEEPSERQLSLLMAWNREVDAPLPTEHTFTLGEFGSRLETLLERYALYLDDLTQVEGIAPDLVDYYRRYGERLLFFLITVQRDPFALVAMSLPQQVEFTDTMRHFYEALFYTTSVALANRLLLQRTQQDVERRVFINQVMSTAASFLDPDKLLNAVGQLIAQRYWTPVMLFRWDGERLRAVAVFYESGETWDGLVGHRFRLIDLPGIGAVVRLRQPLLWHFDARPYRSSIFESILDHLNLASAYSVPLVLRDEVLGVLTVGMQIGHPPLDAVEMMTLQNVAVNLGVAVENARLYQDAQETAEKLKEVDRLKSEFLASMSHELRTPLNSIIGFSRVILKGIDGPLTEMQKTDLTAIYESGRHLLNLINDILDLSKIEAGKMEFIFEPTDLKEIIQGVLTTATALVKDKPIELIADVPDDLPTIIADARRIRQVVLNLVGNAAKFTEKGHIRVRATHDDREVVIAVEDTGIGIPRDKFPLVFQEFQQVDSSSTRRYGGTGLGLPVSKRFVEAHGGRIWFESEEGSGSTFYVALPIGGPQSVAAEEEEEAPVEERAAKRTVLVIDDDSAVVTLFRRFLERHGYAVVGLTHPSRAVAEAKQLRPYAITLDLVMPEMDGWQVLRQLKSDPDTRDIPVVICSVAGDGMEKGITMGVTDYLVKPVTEEGLIGALERLAYTDDIYRILVVDDTQADRKLMRRILESVGHIVEEAEGGQQAIEKLDRQSYDLVILDLMMPQVDGATVLTRIKENPATRHVPVIIVTAKELSEEERRRLMEQAEQLLQKGSFAEEELLRDVLDVLDRLHHEEEGEDEETAT